VKTARLVEAGIGGFAGPARLYELSEPLAGHDRVVVYTSSLYGNEETVVVGESGVSMRPLPGSLRGFTNHEYALFVAGYALEEDGNGA